MLLSIVDSVLRFIHSVAYVILLPCIAEWDLILQMNVCHSLCIQSAAEGQFSCFQLGAIMNKLL